MRVRRPGASVVDALQTAALGLLLLGLMTIPAYFVIETWVGQRQMKASWNIKGPPCPVVDRPSPNVVGRKDPKAFNYGGVDFTRQFGHVSCVAIREPGFMNKESYRVCQFNAPAMVAVATPDGRKVIYQPGVARPATVTVRHGQPSCVIGGWFTL